MAAFPLESTGLFPQFLPGSASGAAQLHVTTRVNVMAQGDPASSSTASLSPVSIPQVAEQLMTIAYESGVNLFDTAEVYAAGK